jgi:AraC-like DNA-binding protein
MTNAEPQGASGIRHTFAADGGSVMLAVPGAEGEMVRTDRGSGDVRVTVLDYETIQLARLQFGFPAVAEAVGTYDSLILCTMLHAGSGRWEGIPLATGQTFAYGPGTTHHAMDPVGLDFAMAVVPWRRFEDAAAVVGVDPNLAAAKNTFVGGPWWPLAATFPFERGGLLVADWSAALMEERVLDAAARAFGGFDPKVRTLGAGRAGSDEDLVRETIAFLNDHPRQPLVPILTLCRHLGVSDRRLQLAFRRRLDVSPNRFMMLRSLQRAHVELANANPNTHRVADIARYNGFAHLGRFAHYYYEVYSELPSATLRRPVT